ncbi:hypothetical protein S40293_09460 [Stachybotrys chartarum IBT 40293]|nr:hypothetical protein S40293_09460 [Stachybotrys chartarum IBT 40293]
MYSPLVSSKSIRVLVLDSGIYDDDIKCCLKQVDLGKKPPFIALSYVWGNPNECAPIECNGATVQVTDNLAAALRRLRHNNDPVVVWADALCINQKDNEEKALQVGMMDEIYSAATQVVVYVGEADVQTPQVVEMIARMWALYVKLTWRREPTTNIHDIFRKAYLQTSPGGELPPHNDVRWVALENFFRRTYFSRIWMIQEIALAVDDPVVFLGEFRIPWKHVATAATLFYLSHIQQMRGNPSNDIRTFNIFHIQTLRELTRLGELEKGFRLESQLMGAKSFNCTDPRDRVYALHAVATDRLDSEGSTVYRVDYTVPPAKVFRDTAAQFLKQGSLFALSHAFTQKVKDLPSWAPDWSTDGVDINALMSGFDREKYCASGDSAARCEFPEDDDSTLFIDGQEITEVQWVSRPFEPMDLSQYADSRTPGTFPTIWMKCKDLLGPDYAGGGTTVNAFWRTLIANVDEDHFPVTDGFFPHFLSWWRESRLWDMGAEEYRDKGGVTMTSTKTQDRYEVTKQTYWNKEQYKAIGGRALRCRCREGAEGTARCLTCRVLEEPKTLAALLNMTGKLPKLRLDDPTEDMVDSDEFIAQWYENIQAEGPSAVKLMKARWPEYNQAVFRPLCGRSLFVTKNGLLGLGPRTARPGDKLVILAGGQVPFVLGADFKEEGSARRYRLRGEAYVHGVMNGSRMECGERGQAAWETFTIV